MPRRARLVIGVAFGAFGLAGVAMGIRVVVDAYSPVPFADFWGEFPFLERAVNGHLRIGDFWAQLNEHRMFIPRIAFLLDYRFFGGTNVFLLVLISVSSGLIACVLASVVWLETKDRLLAWGFFCVAAIAMLSPVASENLTFAIQVGFPQVLLFALVAILAVLLGTGATSAGQRRRDVWVSVAAGSAIAASYSLANGLLTWPILVGLAALLGLGLRSTALLTFVGVLTVFSYVWHFEPVKRHANYKTSLEHPVSIAKYVAVYLGNPLKDVGISAAAFVGVAGLVLLVLLARVAWRDRGRRSLTTVFGAAIALFVCLTALVTAIGRLNFGPREALSSRYTTATMVFWLGLMIGFLRLMLDSKRLLPRVRHIAAAAYFGVAALVVLAIGFHARPSRASLRSTVIGKELTVVAFRAGVDDPARTVTGTPPSTEVLHALGWLQRSKLGPWAPGGMVDDSRITLRTPQVHSTCRGRIETTQPVTGGVRLEGRIQPPPGRSAAHEVEVLDDAGAERGLGLVGTDRSDSFVAYARSRAARPHVVLVAPDHRTPLCRL